jgi:hypothetical protein
LDRREKSLFHIGKRKEKELIVHRSCRNQLLIQQRERERGREQSTTSSDSKILMALSLEFFNKNIMLLRVEGE